MTNPSIFEQYTDKETFAKIVDFANITDMWEHSVKTYGDHSAVVDGEDYTYSALNAQVETFRTVLKNAGIKQGDTVKVTIEGADEDTAAAAIEEFFKANL
mgnify:CR=1 FL=1